MLVRMIVVINMLLVCVEKLWVSFLIVNMMLVSGVLNVVDSLVVVLVSISWCLICVFECG